MARPTVFTKTTLQKLEEAFAWGCSDQEACLYANIAPSSLYAYQEAHAEFLERKEALKQRPVLEARSTVVKALKDNPGLALKFLERKAKDEFSLRTQIKLNVEPSRELSQTHKDKLDALLNGWPIPREEG